MVTNSQACNHPATVGLFLLKFEELKKFINVSVLLPGDAALRVVSALKKNHTLTELRLDNQRHIFGAKVEHEFSKILKENKFVL